MLKILPLASSFHSSEQVRSTIARITRALQARGLPHEIVSSGPADALLIVTGGTEHLALQALQHTTGPAILLAHPDQNSLPASLEILSRLQQQGQRGRIVLLNETETGFDALKGLARHLEVNERLKTLRLGRIGAPSDWLVGSMQEPRLLQQAWGPTIVDVSLDSLRSAMDKADASLVDAIHQDFLSGASAVREPSPGDLAMAARVAAGLRQVIQEHRLDACTVRCFDLVLELKTTGCLALSALLDDGIVAGCEGDLPAAMTMLWMQTMSGQPTFMANPQDLDPATNTLWLAHCTIARKMLKHYALRSHFESSLGVGIQGEVEPGPFTLARIGGSDLRALFVSDGALLVNGASEHRCRTQVQLRLEEEVGQLLSRPLGNHHVLLAGHWARELREYHELFVALSPCPVPALDASSL
jgi:L-fucose isomerase-like protein